MVYREDASANTQETQARDLPVGWIIPQTLPTSVCIQFSLYTSDIHCLFEFATSKGYILSGSQLPLYMCAFIQGPELTIAKQAKKLK